ncbi:hypothetical protein ABZ128_09300 [Streptomyces sp. NPDC006326]|uniref:hypothetical protein n=1 Tax=Streptomyces sp. NPDC006326 TaxID=3156752 RepID=UPI0033AD0A83
MAEEEDEAGALWRSVGWDVWGRPDGPWRGGVTSTSRYLMGGRFLASGRNIEAESWLTRAAEAGHPGAFFRLALVCLRTGRPGEALEMLVDATDRGHKDADRILGAWDDCHEESVSADDGFEHVRDAVAEPQDPAFAAEVAHLVAGLWRQT